MRPGGFLLGLSAAVSRRRAASGAGRLTALALTTALCFVAADSPGASATAIRDPATAERSSPNSHLPPPPGRTELVSQRVGGGFAGGPSAQPAISADGRYVAFVSRAPDLVVGDTNGTTDVFVRDMVRGGTVRLPVPGGAPVPPGGIVAEPTISANGAFVAFTYDAPALTGTIAVVNPPPLIVVWERRTKTTGIVSFTPSGALARFSREPSISGDGRFVAFTTDEIAFEEDESGSDVVVFDRIDREAVHVSVTPDLQRADGVSSAPAISRDGSVVAFQSSADDIVKADLNGATDVFARDLAAATTDWVSIAGNPGGPSEAPAISADGRFVAFESTVSTLFPGDLQNTRDVFVRDRAEGTTMLVSVGWDGGAVAGDSGQSAISDDGRIVAFASTGGGLVGSAGSLTFAQALALSEVYARDVVAGETIRISDAVDGNSGGAQSVGPAIGGQGRYVAFASTSPRLVRGDANGQPDVFRRDLPPVPIIAPPEIDFGATPLGTSALPGAATLRNDGWGPLRASGSLVEGPNAADFAVAFDGCIGRVLRRDEACTASVVFTPTANGQRSAVLQVADNAAGSPRTVRLLGTGSEAQIELDPPVGRPGIVTIATGSGFPAGAELRLSWGRGLTPTMPTVVTDAAGSFRVQVLVFHNDLIGVRELVATPLAGPSFPEFGTPFDVLAARAQPPRFLLDWALNAAPPIVLRR